MSSEQRVTSAANAPWPSVLSPQSTWSVRLDVFEGPLDLLLQLIERRQLDITTVSLALITDQFLAHVAALEAVDAEDLASFIVVAAKLLLIKSRALLPPKRTVEKSEETEDPTDLTERLRTYERIRRAARWLQEREASGQRTYPIVPRSPVVRQRPLRGLDPADLRRAYYRAVQRAAPKHPEVSVQREPFPIERAFSLLAERLKVAGSFDLRAWCVGAESRSQAVALFLAALELIRLGAVECDQPETFGEIRLTAREGVVPGEGRALPAG